MVHIFSAEIIYTCSYLRRRANTKLVNYDILN
jgi:hypothetical protein